MEWDQRGGMPEAPTNVTHDLISQWVLLLASLLRTVLLRKSYLLLRTTIQLKLQ